MLVVASAWCATTSLAQSVRPTLAGYYPDWSRGSYPASVIAYQDLSHIVHAFLIPNADGSLGGTTGFAYPQLVQNAHQSGVMVVVSLGGWGQSDGFSPMAADTAARHRFVQNVKAFCQTNHYDGVDLDWEYPATAADRANLTLLVHELRQSFDSVQPPLSISLAVPAGDWTGKWFDFTSLKNDVDWLGIMTYDFYGSWSSTSGPNSPLYGSWSTNTQGWIDDSYTYYKVTRNVPADKLLIGIPFYGWVFNASAMYGKSTGASQRAYLSIAPLLTQGWTRYWDSQGAVPYLINAGLTQVISYDDTASLRMKADYILQKGIRGAIIWSIDQDYLNGGQPLLTALGERLGMTSDVPSGDAANVSASFILSQNYPNPFNPETRIAYTIGGASEVKLAVYDVLGREVAVLVSERKAPGSYQVKLDGSNLVSGVYLYRLQAGDFVQTKRLVLLK